MGGDYYPLLIDPDKAFEEIKDSIPTIETLWSSGNPFLANQGSLSNVFLVVFSFWASLVMKCPKSWHCWYLNASWSFNLTMSNHSSNSRYQVPGLDRALSIIELLNLLPVFLWKRRWGEVDRKVKKSSMLSLGDICRRNFSNARNTVLPYLYTDGFARSYAGS